MSITSENTFESALVHSLIEQGGYTEGNSPDYNPELGMFENEVIQFLQESQPEQWERISAIHGTDAENRVIQRLYKELGLRGSLDVLRNGFVDYGVRFRLAYFQPASGLNPDAVDLYNKNRLNVYRQVYYSNKSRNSVDVLLSLNGIPVATLELKNQFTGQNAGNALKQYSTTRDSRDILLDRKSTRLNSSHVAISYAVFCLKKKNKTTTYDH